MKIAFKILVILCLLFAFAYAYAETDTTLFKKEKKTQNSEASLGQQKKTSV